MQYNTKIQDLKTAFQGDAVLNTEIVVLRTELNVQQIQENISDLGKAYLHVHIE
jgi:hypothetical protein